MKRLEDFSYQALMITEMHTQDRKIKPDKILLQNMTEQVMIEFTEMIQTNQSTIILQKDSSDQAIYGVFELFKSCFTSLIDNTVRYSQPNEKVILRAF